MVFNSRRTRIYLIILCLVMIGLGQACSSDQVNKSDVNQSGTGDPEEVLGEAFQTGDRAYDVVATSQCPIYIESVGNLEDGTKIVDVCSSTESLVHTVDLEFDPMESILCYQGKAYAIAQNAEQIDALSEAEKSRLQSICE